MNSNFINIPGNMVLNLNQVETFRALEVADGGYALMAHMASGRERVVRKFETWVDMTEWTRRRLGFTL